MSGFSSFPPYSSALGWVACEAAWWPRPSRRGWAWYFFISPQFSFAVQSPMAYVSIGMFVGMGVLFSLTHDRLQTPTKHRPLSRPCLTNTPSFNHHDFTKAKNDFTKAKNVYPDCRSEE